MGREKVRKLLLVSATALTVAVGAKAVDAAAADPVGSVKITGIDYQNLTLTIEANPGDTQVLFATSKTARTWDVVPGELTDDNKITADISWVSASRDKTLYFKGDKSTEPISVTLPKQNKKFKAVFDPMTNTVSFKNQSNSSVGSDGSVAQSNIYWKKSKSEKWTEYKADEMHKLLESFAMNGVTLHFQEGQIPGDANKVGARPSKASSLKIAKRAAAPKVTLNYSKRTFNAKTTMEYKPVNEATWKPVESAALTLKDALPKALEPTAVPDATVSIDFRKKATTKKVSSKICTVEVPVQENTRTDNVNFFYTGSQQCKFTIKQWTNPNDTKDVLEAASSKNPYEYTVVQCNDQNKDGKLEDASNVSWTSITTEETTLSSAIAPDNSKIYIRKKATKSKLATKEVSVIENNGIVKYPTSDTLKDPIMIKRIQGDTNKSTFSLLLGYKEEDNINTENIKITSITHDGKNIEFEAEKVALTDDKDYFISVSIVNTQKLETDAYLNRNLPLKVTLSNGDVIGDVKEGESGNKPLDIKLHIIKKAGIESSSENYVKYVNYGFDNEGIKFTVKPSTQATIESIYYHGQELKNSPADNCEYTKSTTNTDITVTIKKETIDDFQNLKWMKTSEYGTTYPFVVTLNYEDNTSAEKDTASLKETINAVGVKVAYPVEVSADASSIGILESACTGSAITDPEITYKLSSDFCEATGFEVKSAKLLWNKESVLSLYSYNQSNRTVTVRVHLADLPDASKKHNNSSAPLILMLTPMNSANQEFEVDYGYYITLIK